MKTIIRTIYKSVFLAGLVTLSACEDLTELNVSENGASPTTANPNLLMPTVMTGVANSYLDLGIMDVAGVMQHTQKTGWYSAHNSYDWSPRDWSPWYGYERSNKLIYERAVELNLPFHQAVALTMRSFIYGTVTDLWGDAPYTEAVRGDEGSEFVKPTFDTQDVIYAGIIEDLKAASALFAGGDVTGINPAYDVYYGGNVEKWQKFANSLILRYAMRISDKNATEAKSIVEEIYSSGIYIANASDDAMMAYVGANASNSFPTSVTDDGTKFRNARACVTLLDKLVAYDDPRLEVWFAPVHVQWVEDPALPTKMDATIRRNGVLTAKTNIKDNDYRAEKKADPSVVYTRHFNPNLFAVDEELPNTSEYVGIPPAIIGPDYYNYNPTPGQTVENQHVSQYDDIYRDLSGSLLKARLISAAETHFILAEAALKGWTVGDAKTNYENGVKNSLAAWNVSGDYASYIAEPGVAYNGTLEQVIEQKWIASWTSATESWMDYRRTGLPALQTGPASPEPVLPVRFIYSDDETLRNEDNANEAIDRLEETDYSNLRGANSQWSKPWIIQGTGKPWN
ncbi:MAG TPA: SusD/RagB family nutrient-binding outer membrane lipoprotein [Chryseolinea sp.]